MFNTSGVTPVETQLLLCGSEDPLHAEQMQSPLYSLPIPLFFIFKNEMLCHCINEKKKKQRYDNFIIKHFIIYL